MNGDTTARPNQSRNERRSMNWWNKSKNNEKAMYEQGKGAVKPKQEGQANKNDNEKLGKRRAGGKKREKKEKRANLVSVSIVYWKILHLVIGKYCFLFVSN